MSWLWLWTDILDSEKIAELDDPTFRGWIMILACAKRNDAAGDLPPLKKLAYWCRRPESIVKGWLLILVDHGLIDRDDDSFSVHDWDQWQPRNPGPRPIPGGSGKAMSNADRQRRYRERQKSMRNDVTPPLHSPEENNREEERRERITLRNDNCLVMNNDVTLRYPPPPPLSSLPLDDLQQQCIDQATRLWGASNGDMIVGELLRTFSAEIVMESMDVHFEKFKQDLKPAYLRKTCEGKFRDNQRKKGSS
jgi:hypothetical protein